MSVSLQQILKYTIMINVLNAANSLYNGEQIVEKVMKDVKKMKSPILVRNLGSHSVTNEIEIVNSGKSDITDVRVEIVGAKRDDCYWDSPNNDDDKVLFIEYLCPNSSLVFELVYSNSENSIAEFQISWKDWRNKMRTQTLQVHLRGWGN